MERCSRWRRLFWPGSPWWWAFLQRLGSLTLSRLKDPGFVVIDEVAGQLITFIAVPVSWQSLLLGFILFRGFDIVKPPPVRMLERLPDGVGIVLTM